MKYTNQLIHETSPYLLQHAHNPVDWMPWGDVALQRAKLEDKPILVSIGYAACHWCHVMEKESFEDELTAKMMNDHFICIKIDREERPDLDHFFMDALQAIEGNGGWPLNMFLTSDAKPFFGGTYFPPKRMYNRHSWQEVLQQIQQAYKSRRSEIERQASNLINYLSKSSQQITFTSAVKLSASLDVAENCEQSFQAILKIADKQHGGFGAAPKFPQTFTIQYLLRFGFFHGNDDAINQAELSLKSMLSGGIYDQVGGGFCRYSTDREWLVPHFEKMTYDNALLLIVLSEAYQLTKNKMYKRTAVQTIDFMKREMMSDHFGFYAALDADSEGSEGKFYTWSYEEFADVLQGDAQIFSDYFDVTENGNWEGVNILRTHHTVEEWSLRQGISIVEADQKIKQATELLLFARNKRVRPGTDDKVILGWNALFNHALVKCSMAFDEPDWLQLAVENMEFMLSVFYNTDSTQWMHTYKNGESKFPAFIDDLAYLAQALLTLYEPTGNLDYLEKARDIINYTYQNYIDESGTFFYYTPSFQQDILVRKKDIYDGALPSGNAVMCWNLYRAGILLGEETWRQQAVNMLLSVKEGVVKYPNSFGVWANFMLELDQGTHEILILGADATNLGRQFLQEYITNKVVMLATKTDDKYPLLKDKRMSSQTLFYLCKDYTCQVPLSSIDAAFSKVLTKS